MKSQNFKNKPYNYLKLLGSEIKNWQFSDFL